MKDILVIVGALIVLGVAGYCAKDSYDAARRAEGVLAERTADWTRERESLRKLTPGIESVFVTKTATATKLIHHFDTALVTVEKNITDTVIVKEFIRVADSTVGACSGALSACSLLNTNLKTQLVLSDSILTATKARIPKPPSAFDKLTRTVERALAVVGIGAIVIGVRK